MMLQLVSTVLLLIVYKGDAQNPGFQTTITAKGLDYIRQVGIPILEQQLASVTIPDVSGSAGTPIGSVDYDLTSIHLSNLKIPSSALKSGSSGLVVQASDISIDGNAHWHYREHSWPHISDSGTLDMSVSNVGLSISIIVGKDNNDHPTLKTTGCSLSVGSLSVKFHGGASWLYNLFSGSIANSVKKSMQGQICDAATKAINDQGNKALESLPVIVKIDKIAEVNYELVKDPIFNTAYIETQHKGEFFSITKPVEAPFSPPVLPAVNSTDKMMYVWLTDYIANTAGVVYQTSGIMKFTVTPDMVPSNLPIKLNTESFKVFIPQLYNAYPNMPMQLILNATKPPVLKVDPTIATFTVVGNVDVDVIKSDKSVVNAFVLGLTIYANVTVSVKQNGTKEIVTADCTLIKFDMSLVSTTIGQFSVDLLQKSVNTLVNLFILPFINIYANAGLVIPVVDGMSFVNPEVKFGKDYILISTDINYKPSL